MVVRPVPIDLLIPALPPSRITIQAVHAAAALIEDYFKPMAERVFGDAALPEADRLAATLARWILKERPKVVNARDLRRKARLPACGRPQRSGWRWICWSKRTGCAPLPAVRQQRRSTARGLRVNPKLWEARDA